MALLGWASLWPGRQVEVAGKTQGEHGSLIAVGPLTLAAWLCLRVIIWKPDYKGTNRAMGVKVSSQAAEPSTLTGRGAVQTEHVQSLCPADSVHN